MAEYKDVKEQAAEECIRDCDTVYSFLKLTDEMVKTIIDLDEELFRWRQALIKYLPSELNWQMVCSRISSITSPEISRVNLHTIYMSDWCEVVS